MSALTGVSILDTDFRPGWSYLYNNNFDIWPQGELIRVPAGRDLYVCGGWRVVNNHGAGDAVAEKIGVTGGIRITVTFSAPGQYVYLRELLPGLRRFCGGTYTAAVEVGKISGNVALDFYGQARYSELDEQRIKVADTDNSSLAVADQLFYTTFNVPHLDPASPWAMTDRSSLELAFRLVSVEAGPVTIEFHGVSLAEGFAPRYPALNSPQSEEDSVFSFEQVGSFRHTGFSSNPGQKSLWVPYRPKTMLVTKANIVLSDVLGNVGKISCYDQLGYRYDNIVPIIGGAPKDGYKYGFSVILQDSGYVGVAGMYRVMAY